MQCSVCSEVVESGYDEFGRCRVCRKSEIEDAGIDLRESAKGAAQRIIKREPVVWCGYEWTLHYTPVNVRPYLCRDGKRTMTEWRDRDVTVESLTDRLLIESDR